MADLTDVTAYLAQQAFAAIYPNGTSQPSVANMDCRIFEGWPIPDQLDLDLTGFEMDASQNPPVKVPLAGGPIANVSIFPMQGTGVQVYQILDKTYDIVPPAINSTVTVAGNVITVAGQIAAGEYLTIIVDDAVIASQSGVTTAAMLAALAAQLSAAGYTSTATATTLTVNFGHSMVVRQGGAGIQGKVTHRQRHSVMVTVWAPNTVVRGVLASAIDNLIKQANKVSMPDSSQAVIVYSRTNVIDEQQSQAIYRRDLIYDVEYATVEQFPAYVVTSTQVAIAKPSNTAVATAIA